MARNDLIQVRRDTAANWTDNNPILATGEIGFETDTGKLKVGTASTAWNSLLYVTDASDVSGVFSSGIFSGSSSTDLVRITQTGTGNALVVEDSNPDSTPFVVTNAGDVRIGTANNYGKLNVDGSIAIHSATPLLNLMDASNTRLGYLYHDATNLQLLNHSASGGIQLATNSTNRFIINSAGEVGIASPPTSNIRLTITGGSTNSANPVIMLNGVSGSGALYFHNDMSAGSYNPIVTAGAKGIIATGANNTTTRGALVIAPWSDVNYGIRFTGGSTTDILVRGTTTFTPTLAANKALIVQGVASQAGDFFDIQESGGASRFKVDASGNLFVASNITTNDANTKIGWGRTGNGYSYIDLIGDATYDNYGFRVIRNSNGANANSELQHRGTGNFALVTQEAAPILFSTSNAERMRITSDGSVGINAVPSAFAKVHIGGTLPSSSNLTQVFRSVGTIPSTSTSGVWGYLSAITTQAASFTLTNLFHFSAEPGAKGLNSTITNQYGFFANSVLTGAANNYGFYGDIPADTGRWNLFMSGNANNYLAGRLGIGATLTSGATTQITNPNASPADKVLVVKGALTQSGSLFEIQNSGGTPLVTVNSAGAFVGPVSSIRNFGDTHFSSFQARADSSAQGLLAGYSFYPTFVGTGDNGVRRAADISAGFTGAWGTEYLSFGVGTGGANDTGAKNTERMRITGAGNVGIGTASPTEKLDVAGNIALTGSIVFEGATADGFETTLAVTDPTTTDRTITLPNASGTVALLGTIALGTDTTGNYMSGISGTSPVSVSHTASEGSSATVSLASNYGDTLNPYAAKTAAFVLAGPTTGAAAVPTFRAIVATDIPTLNQNTTGSAATAASSSATTFTSSFFQGTYSTLQNDHSLQALRSGNGGTAAGVALWVTGIACQFRLGTGEEKVFLQNSANTSPAGFRAIIDNASSRHLKQDIKTFPMLVNAAGSAVNEEEIESGLNIVRQLRPVTYKWKEKLHLSQLPSNPRRALALSRLNEIRSSKGLEPYESDELQHDCSRDDCNGTAESPCSRVKNWENGNIGFIAQEVGALVPQAANLDKDGEYSGIDNVALTAIAVASIKELDLIVESLKERIKQLEESNINN